MAETNLIASAPGINGNVGSCTTQKITVDSARTSFFVVETKDITTNSCTGEVNSYDSWRVTESGFVSCVFAPIVFCVCLMIIAHAFGWDK